MSVNPYDFYLYIKLGLLVLFILINIIQYYIFPQQISKQIYIALNNMIIFLTNSKIKIHGNVDNLNNNVIIMSNHYDGMIDANILFNLHYKHNCDNILYSIVKSTLMCDPEDKQLVMRLMSYIKNGFINSSYFIKYKRGDKEDGNNVKNIIVETIRSKNNVLVFPEGTTRTNGIPKDFKNGIFQLAVENKINILPITLKFNKDIGSEKGEPIKILNIFDNVVDIHIHEVIDSTSDECYRNNDFITLKNKVFHIIKTPMLV
jgi:1-acyl-sn-glycerol-3-phosphate acyltransferase